MFVEAEVRTLLIEGEMRHFLEPTDAKYGAPTTKRLRLMQRKFDQVSNAGGMLVKSRKQLAALEQIGVVEVVINTDKSDVVPDLSGEAPKPPAPTEGAGAAADETRAVVGPAQQVDITGTNSLRGIFP